MHRRIHYIRCGYRAVREDYDIAGRPEKYVLPLYTRGDDYLAYGFVTGYPDERDGISGTWVMFTGPDPRFSYLNNARRRVVVDYSRRYCNEPE